MNCKNEDGNDSLGKSKSKVDNCKKDKITRQAKENTNKETKSTKTVKHTATVQETRFNNTSDTTVILEALDNVKTGLENKIDNIEKKTNEHLGKLQNEMNSIRADFNQRLEGLAKKVELRVLKAVENDTKEKLKKLEKEMRKDMDKMKRSLDNSEAGVRKLSQTDLPIVQEKLGDEIDRLAERVTSLERNKTDSSKFNEQERNDERTRRIVVRNLVERENENIKDRVNNIIDYLKVREISVETAERKANNYNSKPGVVIATFASKDDKEKVMKVKRNLKDGTRYHDVYLENDIPVHQRKMKNNLRTIVNTLGREKLKLRGSRIIRADESNDTDQHGTNSGNRNGEHTRRTDSYQAHYEPRNPRSNNPHHHGYDTSRSTRYHDNYQYRQEGRDDRDRRYHNHRDGYRRQ